ncbi:MAG: hypothetical protein JKY49_18200 [Cohaesibacteraceae bacterium]|nr:hypothetical protein [Cohaesibacteraceae bacterium]
MFHLLSRDFCKTSAVQSIVLDRCVSPDRRVLSCVRLKSCPKPLHHIWVFFLFLALSLLQYNPVSASSAARIILSEARASCASFDNGTFRVSPQAFVQLDLTGDGVLDEILDSHYFSCSSSPTFFCGGGGCTVVVIVNGMTFDFQVHQFKRARDQEGEIIFKTVVHWSLCNYKKTCWEAWKWNGLGFSSLGNTVEIQTAHSGVAHGPISENAIMSEKSGDMPK